MTAEGHRPIHEIAVEIMEDWPDPYFGARPYLAAMLVLDDINDVYGVDSAESILLYFLSNAHTWHGEKARAIKQELRMMLSKPKG
jgi:hypothetical protein